MTKQRAVTADFQRVALNAKALLLRTPDIYRININFITLIERQNMMRFIKLFTLSLPVFCSLLSRAEEVPTIYDSLPSKGR